MTISAEEKLNQKLQKPDYLIIAGSTLYGTDTSDSDKDYRGFILPPFEYLVGALEFEQYNPKCSHEDIVIYSLKKFIKLLMNGDPVCLEMLFAPEWAINYRSEIGGIIRRNRNLFLSRKFINRILGYSESEFRKVKGVTLKPIKKNPNEQQVIDDIRNVFHLPKQEMDGVINILFAHHSKKIVNSTRKLGQKRKSQIEKFGYCVSSASHTVRLLGQLLELLTELKITFPRPNAEFLRNIKLGKISLEQVESTRSELMLQIKVAEHQTLLPKTCSSKKIFGLYYSIIRSSMLKELDG